MTDGMNFLVTELDGVKRGQVYLTNDRRRPQRELEVCSIWKVSRRVTMINVNTGRYSSVRVERLLDRDDHRGYTLLRENP